MSYKVITISREFGSAGRTIGKQLAEALNIKCYDKEIIEKVAEESGFAKQYVEEKAEEDKRSFLDSFFSNSSLHVGPSNEDSIWIAQCQVIQELAKEPCVIVGRCADYLLQEREDVLRIFVHADLQTRAKRIVEVYGENEKDPITRVKDKDRKRIAYYQHYTNLDWGSAYNYHITLDSGVLGVDNCVDIIKKIYSE